MAMSLRTVGSLEKNMHIGYHCVANRLIALLALAGYDGGIAPVQLSPICVR